MTTVANETSAAGIAPARGEVLIRLGAVSVAPCPGAAGMVVAVGGGSASHALGDRVLVYPVLACGSCACCTAGIGERYCLQPTLWRAGTSSGQTGLARVPAENLVAISDAVSFAAAATLPVTYLTAWHGLVDRTQVGHTDTVVVLGAGGAVGVAGLQVARRFGARVIAVVDRESQRGRAIALGADATVCVQDESWTEELRAGCDGQAATVVFGEADGFTWNQAAALAPGARTVRPGGVDAGSYVLGTRANLEDLLAVVAAGDISPVIDSSFRLPEAPTAERRLAAGDRFGSVVLDLTMG